MTDSKQPQTQKPKRKPNPIRYEWAMDGMGLSAEAFRVFAFLCARANEDGASWFSKPVIGSVCFPDLSPERAKKVALKVIRMLSDRGMITVRKVCGEGARTQDFYTIMPMTNWVMKTPEQKKPTTDKENSGGLRVKNDPVSKPDHTPPLRVKNDPDSGSKMTRTLRVKNDPDSGSKMTPEYLNSILNNQTLNNELNKEEGADAPSNPAFEPPLEDSVEMNRSVLPPEPTAMPEPPHADCPNDVHPEFIEAEIVTTESTPVAKPTRKRGKQARQGPPISEADIRLGSAWFEYGKRLNPALPSTPEKFAKAIWEIRQKTNLTQDGVERLFEWVRKNDFWANQCQSPAGLLRPSRSNPDIRKIDQILSQMNKGFRAKEAQRALAEIPQEEWDKCPF